MRQIIKANLILLKSEFASSYLPDKSKVDRVVKKYASSMFAQKIKKDFNLTQDELITLVTNYIHSGTNLTVSDYFVQYAPTISCKTRKESAKYKGKQNAKII